MIKIIENGQGVKVGFNDIEVFNHTAVVPFIKSLKGNSLYAFKRNKLTANMDIYGEYALNNYRVLVGGLHSGNIKFWQYDNKEVKLHMVEKNEKLIIEFSQSEQFPVLLTFFSNAYEQLFIDNTDIKGKKYSNVIDAKIPLLERTKHKIINHINFNEKVSLLSSRGYRFDIFSQGLIEFDMTKKMTYQIIFEHLPQYIEVCEDNSKINEEVNKLYASLSKNIK